MPIAITFQQQKERILSLIQMRGPSMSIQISKWIGVSSLFAGAFLSDLYAEKKVKMSNMKVGSSSLYYLDGQEASLENFIEHLQQREKEAFLHLKKESVLDDETQTPVMRVALRAIKDFAIPIRARVNEEVKLFWKYFLMPDSDAKKIMQEKLGLSEPAEKMRKEEKVVVEGEVEKKAEEAEESAEKAGETSEEKAEIVEIKAEKKEETKKKEKKKKKKIQENEFSKKMKDYLSGRDIELIEVLLEKKREFVARVRVDMVFWKQEFLLVAKDKKLISDSDLTVALQNAQSVRMPALFMSLGKLHKKGEEYLKEWSNLVKFERIKF